jgi:hypothetical protein
MNASRSTAMQLKAKQRLVIQGNAKQYNSNQSRVMTNKATGNKAVQSKAVHSNQKQHKVMLHRKELSNAHSCKTA